MPISSLADRVRLPEPEQKVFDGIEVPLVLECNKATASLTETTRWVTQNQAELTDLLHTHGAILFRGFPLEAATKFDEFVLSFKGWEDLPYEESLSYAVRLKVPGTQRVCTSNEGKTGGLIFHHEQAQAPVYPSGLFFYCQSRDMSEPGGATAVCPSSEVYKRINAKYPDFIKQISEHGVRYTGILDHKPDPSKGVGRGWDTFFGQQCDTREEVEQRMRELKYDWEWLDDKGTLRMITPILKAVRRAPGSGKYVFFNQLPATFANAKEFAKGHGGNSDLDNFVRAGDGSSLPLEAMEYAKEQCEDTAVEIEWRPSDVCLLDNFMVMHARRLFEGNKRKVMASLIKSDLSAAPVTSRL